MTFTIKQARQYKGLTQKQAASQLGIALQTYRAYEWGKTDMRINLAKKFATIVDIPFNQIIFFSFGS